MPNHSAKLGTALACLFIALGAAQTRADVIYTNGAINGNLNAGTIADLDGDYGSGNNYYVSDSFDVSSSATLTSVTDAGFWTEDPAAAPTTIDWSIGTTAFGSDIASGTSTVSSTFLGIAYGEYDVYSTSFALSGNLSAGTYFLTLGNADVAPTLWDENDGPSQYFEEDADTGVLVDGALGGSESFTINGTVDVPDGGSTAIMIALVLGALAAASPRLRRRTA